MPANNARWDHDLHETVLDRNSASSKQTAQNGDELRTGISKKSTGLTKTIHVGNVVARIFIPSMESPKVLERRILVQQHTRLPDLRPPLRRDKPVRISLPGHAPRYIFPTVDRSFIFIPRAQRPNQQGKIRARGGHMSKGGSRRTSVYGGSGYSPSIAVSRRSSMGIDGTIMPQIANLQRPPGGVPTGPSRPVVRFPGQQNFPSLSAATEVHSHGRNSISVVSDSTYPLPSEPARREHRSSQMTMHQPRPQKQMSVASIEGDQQPFHQQIPFATAAHQSSGQGAAHPTYSTLPEGSTPLPNIPEGAINAQPFQPAIAANPAFYGYPMHPMYYFSGLDTSNQHSYTSPPIASPYIQSPGYFLPVMMPYQPPEDARQPNMFLQETNGMVYYYDSSNLADSEGAQSMMMVGTGPEGYYTPPSAGMGFYASQ